MLLVYRWENNKISRSDLNHSTTTFIFPFFTIDCVLVKFSEISPGNIHRYSKTLSQDQKTAKFHLWLHLSIKPILEYNSTRTVGKILPAAFRLPTSIIQHSIYLTFTSIYINDNTQDWY